MMFQLRKPNVIPINDHVWLLDDNYEASCYVVSGTKQTAVIDTSVGLQGTGKFFCSPCHPEIVENQPPIW